MTNGSYPLKSQQCVYKIMYFLTCSNEKYRKICHGGHLDKNVSKISGNTPPHCVLNLSHYDNFKPTRFLKGFCRYRDLRKRLEFSKYF